MVATLAYVGVWTFVLVLFAVRWQALYTFTDAALPSTSALAYSAADWLPWLLFCPVVIWLTIRVPVSRDHPVRALLVHVPAMLLLTVIQAAFRAPLLHLLGLPSRPSVFAVVFVTLMQSDFMLYAVVAGVTHATQYARRLRERERAAAASELRTVQLERTLTESRLSLLRTQLEPHFLVNTMHAISALMHQDVEAADVMLTRLSDLLRASMADSSRHEVPLDEELDFSERYLGIQRARLGPRLRTEIRIQSDVLQAKVPSMLLQPLLENAIRHGIAPRLDGGCVELEASAHGQTLRIIVRDDGAGLHESFPATGGSGIGLRNTMLRLRHLYGDAASLDVRRRSSAGTEVIVTLPLNTYVMGAHRTAAAAAASSATIP